MKKFPKYNKPLSAYDEMDNSLNLNAVDRLYDNPDKNRHYRDDDSESGGYRNNKIDLSKYTMLKFQNASIILMIIIVAVGWYNVRTATFENDYAPGSLLPVWDSPRQEAKTTSKLIYDESKDITKIKGELVYINQMDENLPNACEAVSMTMILKQYIRNLTPDVFIGNFLPVAPIYNDNGILKSVDPTYSYIGDPFGAGYGIFAEGLRTAAANCIKEYGLNVKCYDITGCSDETLFSYIDRGIYAVVWLPIDLQPVYWGVAKWHLPSGKLYFWPSGNHCVVLTGYNDTEVEIYDPIKGIVKHDKALFLTRWGELGPYKGQGRQALVVY